MGIKEVNARPSWDVIYMTMAFELSSRSLDPRTKHGCFVVAEDYSPLSFGFNSPPQGCCDEIIPLDAPDKYRFFAHSEQNAIDNAAGLGISLRNSVFYITGFPCPRCFQSIRRVKAQKIIYGPVGSHMITADDKKAVEIMNMAKNGEEIIKMIKFETLGDIQDIRGLQNKTWEYIQYKCSPTV